MAKKVEVLVLSPVAGLDERVEDRISCMKVGELCESGSLLGVGVLRPEQHFGGQQFFLA